MSITFALISLLGNQETFDLGYTRMTRSMSRAQSRCLGQKDIIDNHIKVQSSHRLSYYLGNNDVLLDTAHYL